MNATDAAIRKENDRTRLLRLLDELEALLRIARLVLREDPHARLMPPKADLES
ncbi:hypothetical protein [Mitsuaria sp. GD03876]|uniref:hypothetical protein n=1 Tax=Mitsuaria sp. GD03876 TaxID=2975399 RepID=UPI00244B458E|nr:hypothetical protein [Mitsuaria sp. GD03876]MDH0863803.1 hypothetical protein [Mitsuaria sp. GD03876]